jgi:very-short-patch-repair endonuclease
VKTRLDKVGLGPFCLEVHSKEASKAAVMQQLRASFEVTRTRDSAAWHRHSTELASVRGELNAYAGLLDKASPFGVSTRGVLAFLFGKESIPRVNLPAVDIAHLTVERVATLTEVTDRLARAVHEAGGLTGHPWRAVQRDDWEPTWQRQVEAAVRELAARADTAELARTKLALLLELPAETALPVLTAAALVLLETPAPPAKLLDSQGFDARVAELRAMVTRGRTFAERRETLRQAWTEGLWSLDVTPLRAKIEQWAHAFFLLAWVMLWSVKRRLQPLAKAGLPDNAALAKDLAEATWQQSEAQALASPETQTQLGQVWRGPETDWTVADRLLQWAGQFRVAMLAIANQTGTLASGQKLLQLATDDAALLAPGLRHREALTGVIEAAQALDSAQTEVEILLQLDVTLAFGAQPTPGKVAEFSRVWREALPRLRNWCTLAGTLQQAHELGLQPLATGLEAGHFDSVQLREVLDRSLRESWWEQRLQSEPPLRSFRESSHAERIARFRDLDRRALHLARQEVIARVAERAPDANAPGDEMGLLRRQLLLQRRHMPIRQLFAKIPTTLRRLKPCVLMSPLSVAQYLDPSIEAFDVVVFDEASQIPPWDAVGAIARGKQVIVVGDSKQLPPTSFFDRGGDDEDESALDDEATQDTESILDEMVAARMRELLLKWHYRSKHESLIAFSNWHYYENRLHTFPSAAADVPDLGVKLVRVAGFYDRGGSRTNRAEAMAVVDEMFRLLCLPDAERPSIGVVTFSQVQQRLVEDLVDARLKTLPHLHKYFGDQASEPVFVKNLENVQGDERDVMLFSICYGPDAAGKMTMNFGPLNRKGGERRLNVAVTRARTRLMVFSTVDWGQIDENKSRATGVAHLKAFLRYAALGPSSLLSTTSAPDRDEFGSPFEAEVHRVLTADGWQVHTQVGCSGYRIDLGVVDPKRVGTYLLGIECDGVTYHGSRVARERDRLREDVLVSLGWRIHRIWSTDWWYEREAATKRLLTAVREAAASSEAGAPPPLPVATLDLTPVRTAQDSGAFAAQLATPAAPTWPADTARFVTPTFRGQAGDREAFYAAEARRQLAHSVADIVREFGPIHVDTVTRLIANQWGFGRTGKQIADQILGALPLLAEDGRPRHANGCLWPQGYDPLAWRGFRYVAEGDSRTLDEVPHEEIANVAAWVLSRALAISQAELVRETAKVLGAKAVTNKTTGIIEAALPLVERSGRGKTDGGKWRMA